MTSIPVEICRTSSNNFKTALSQKQKIFSAIFIAFIKPPLNLERFDQKKVSLLVFSISQSTDSERGGYLNVQSALLQNTFR